MSKLFWSAILIACNLGCAKPPALVETSGHAFGTTYHVQLVATYSDLKKISQGIDQTLATVDKQMSSYRRDSELSQFNRVRDRAWFPVSKETLQVIETALEIQKTTDGLFDVSLAPVVDLWGFGPKETVSLPPDTLTLNQLLPSTMKPLVEINREMIALRKLEPQVNLDLSALAKGHAVDQVAKLLDSMGIAQYLVEIGGEIRVRGKKPGDQPWVIAIEHPKTGENPLAKLQLSDKSVATSGDYRNFVEIQEQQFSHLIDPRDGQPIQHALKSATVIHDQTIMADAYATALMIMGPESALKFAEEHNLAILLVIQNQSDFELKVSPAMQAYFDQNKKAAGLSRNTAAIDGANPV